MVQYQNIRSGRRAVKDWLFQLFRITMQDSIDEAWGGMSHCNGMVSLTRRRQKIFRSSNSLVTVCAAVTPATARTTFSWT